MTENEYINTSNLATFRSARDILVGIVVIEKGREVIYQQIIRLVYSIIDDLEKSVDESMDRETKYL